MNGGGVVVVVVGWSCGWIFVARPNLAARSKYFLSELGDKKWVTIMTGLLSLDLSLEILGRPCL